MKHIKEQTKAKPAPATTNGTNQKIKKAQVGKTRKSKTSTVRGSGK